MNACMALTSSFQTRTETLTEQGKERLTNWAIWIRGDSTNGYPKIEPFTRLVTPAPEGPIGPLPEEVAQTDRAVSVLRHRHKSILWRAIEQYFLRSDAVTVSMQACSTSRRGYYRLVDRACVKVMELIRDQS